MSHQQVTQWADEIINQGTKLSALHVNKTVLVRIPTNQIPIDSPKHVFNALAARAAEAEDTARIGGNKNSAGDKVQATYLPWLFEATVASLGAAACNGNHCESCESEGVITVRLLGNVESAVPNLAQYASSLPATSSDSYGVVNSSNSTSNDTSFRGKFPRSARRPLCLPVVVQLGVHDVFDAKQ